MLYLFSKIVGGSRESAEAPPLPQDYCLVEVSPSADELAKNAKCVEQFEVAL